MTAWRLDSAVCFFYWMRKSFETVILLLLSCAAPAQRARDAEAQPNRNTTLKVDVKLVNVS